jgi:hypothetical protein
MGGSHSRDLRWTAEETANDRDSWCKTTTRTQGLATRKESRNGATKQRLARGECTAVAYLSERKSCEKGRKLRPANDIYSRRRERGEVVPHLGVEPDGGTMAHAGFLCSGTLTGGPRLGF